GDGVDVGHACERGSREQTAIPEPTLRRRREKQNRDEEGGPGERRNQGKGIRDADLLVAVPGAGRLAVRAPGGPGEHAEAHRAKRQEGRAYNRGIDDGGEHEHARGRSMASARRMAACSSGAASRSRALCDMVRVTAVELARPPNTPTRRVPRRGPSACV